jgi:SAM-dependent methyltransferase
LPPAPDTTVAPVAAVSGIVSVEDLARQYRETATAVRWPLAPDLEEAPAVTLRNGFAVSLVDFPAPDVCVRHAGCSIVEMEETVAIVQRHLLTEPIQGDGIELGAGCGLLSALLARSPLVRTVLALEVCAAQVQLLIPKVADHLLGAVQGRKVVPIAGSFDDLRIPSASLDFAFEYHAFHHSADLARTVRECARVLRPGGVAVLIDRVQPDSLTDEQIRDMLARVYSPEFLARNAYPLHLKLTRAENGEHEYRTHEWTRAIAFAGLRLEGRLDVHRRRPPADSAGWKRARWHVRETVARLGGRRPVLGPRRETMLLLRKPA